MPFSVLLLDLDNFKSINDTYGHDFGDTVLIEFSKLLESLFLATVLKARYGGEEFVVILPKEVSQNAAKIAGDFWDCVSRHIILTLDHQQVALTYSIDIAQVDNVASYTDEFKQVDQDLYSAKE